MRSCRKSIVYQLFVISCFTGICLAVDSRPLDEGEKIRLRSAWNRSAISRAMKPIDVTFSRTIINSPRHTEFKNKERQQKNEEFKKDPKTSDRWIGTFSLMSPNKEEVLSSQSRVRMGGLTRNGLTKYREDLIVFGDEKKEKKGYDASHINNDGANVKIDRNKKWVSYNDKFNWGAHKDIVNYGTFVGHGEIVRDIIRACRTKKAKKATTREFRHKGVVKIAGKNAVVIELFDLKNNHPVYELSLDVDDWAQCYKLVWYSETGLFKERVTEYSKFKKDKTSDLLYPRIIVKKHFNDEYGEEERDVINIQDVSLDALLDDSVFEVHVTDDYTVSGKRPGLPEKVSQKAKEEPRK